MSTKITKYGLVEERNYANFTEFIYPEDKFILYQITECVYNPDNEDYIDIVDEKKVIAPNFRVVKKYIEHLAEVDGSEWEWTEEETAYQTLDKKRYMVYEELDSITGTILLDK